MASEVFYRKWRPQTLAEVVGQEQVTQTLLHALSSERVSHAYLFYGPRGTGKTSTGRILAKAVNCLTNGKGEPCGTCPMCQAITEGRALDVIEIDAASNRGIDEIRSLRERVNYAPNQARYKVYIIDEVHMLTKEASNALLKTLEEPPPHAIFILATTEAHKILPTILSRCQRFDFRRLSQAHAISKLAHICSAEDIHIEPEGLRLIAKASTGSLRDAENLLEQLTIYYGSDIELSQIQTLLGISGDWRAKEMVKNIINSDISAGMTTINSVNSDGLDLHQFNREVVEYLRALLLIKTGSDESLDLTADDIGELKDLAAKASPPQILTAVKLFGQLKPGFDNYSTLPLELALVDCVLSAEEKKKGAISPTESETQPPIKAAAPPVTSPHNGTLPPKPKSVSKPEPEAVAAVTTSKPEVVSKPEPEPEAVAAVTTSKSEPASEPEPEVVTSTTQPEPSGELKELRLNWRQVIEQAPDDTKRTAAIAILRSAGVKPAAIEGDTIVLAFKYPLHKESMEKPENQQVIRKIVSHFLGHSCNIRCIHEPERNHLLKATLKIGAEIIDVEEK